MKAKFNLLARMVGAITSVLLASCEGPVAASITVTSPENAAITFDQANDVVVSAGSALAVTVAEVFDSYTWVFDGVILPGQNASIAIIDSSASIPGVHHLTALVLKDGRGYSKTLRFKIEN